MNNYITRISGNLEYDGESLEIEINAKDGTIKIGCEERSIDEWSNWARETSLEAKDRRRYATFVDILCFAEKKHEQFIAKNKINKISDKAWCKPKFKTETFLRELARNLDLKEGKIVKLTKDLKWFFPISNAFKLHYAGEEGKIEEIAFHENRPYLRISDDENQLLFIAPKDWPSLEILDESKNRPKFEIGQEVISKYRTIQGKVIDRRACDQNKSWQYKVVCDDEWVHESKLTPCDLPGISKYKVGQWVVSKVEGGKCTIGTIGRIVRNEELFNTLLPSVPDYIVDFFDRGKCWMYHHNLAPCESPIKKTKSESKPAKKTFTDSLENVIREIDIEYKDCSLTLAQRNFLRLERFAVILDEKFKE